ncbi:MAG: hypothetical protein QM535_01430 [Limnohabitans sp.]|nr:hypothetical protein [Limnohabitans sp.]
MKRRNFVKNLGIFTTGTMIMSGSNLYSSEIESIKNIDFSPFSKTNKIIVKGNFVDSKTLQPVKEVTIFAKQNKSSLFHLNKKIETIDGTFEIQTAYSEVKKIKIEIQANGYKPYHNFIYLTKQGCFIHSDEWKYNPDFKEENCPKNTQLEQFTISNFNFHLIKE